jgi:hypothetical protein
VSAPAGRHPAARALHAALATLGALAPLLAALACAVLLGGCAAPAAQQGMAAPAASVARQHDQAVSVSVSGGSETGALDSSNIGNAELKAAIEQSIATSGLFKAVLQGDAPYALSASIVQLRKPLFGGSFTAELEVGWTLVRGADRAVLWRKVLASQGTATMGDSLVGVTRLRLAVERAAQDNIRQALGELAALTL